MPCNAKDRGMQLLREKQPLFKSSEGGPERIGQKSQLFLLQDYVILTPVLVYT